MAAIGYRQRGERVDESDSVFFALPQPDNPSAANTDARLSDILERVEAVVVGASGDDGRVEFRRRVHLRVCVCVCMRVWPIGSNNKAANTIINEQNNERLRLWL